MKRSPLQRRTFIRSKRKQRRRSSRVYDPEFIQWVKYTQPCSVTVEWPDVDLPPTPCDGPIEADHAGPRGYGQKSSDTECIALCKQHHEERTNRTGLSGSFKTLNRITAREWRARQIARHQQLYRESKGDAVTHPEEPATAWCEKCQATTYLNARGRCGSCVRPRKKKRERTPEQREKSRILVRALRAKRRANNQCYECGAGLQESDTVLCVECTERNRLTAERYRYRNRNSVRERSRANARRMRAADPAADRERVRKRRLQKKLNGECMRCPKLSEHDGYNMCSLHREVELARRRNAWRRKHSVHLRDAPLDMRAYVGRRAMAPPDQPKQSTDYRPFDDADRRLRTRMLIAIRFHDWVTGQDINDQMGIEHDARNAATVTLQRLVKDGLVERRDIEATPEYRITQAGKIECDQLRKGRAA